MRVANIYPTMPIANGGAVAAVSPISATSFEGALQTRDWWDVVSSQLGTRVTDMLRDSLYGNNFNVPTEPTRLSTEELLRFTLENEIRQSQIQQRIFNQELQEQNQQIKVAQIYAKSDLWLAEKDRLEREREAQKEAELRVLARSQGAESAADMRASDTQQATATAQTQAQAPASAPQAVGTAGAESAAISAVAPLSEQAEQENLGNANADSDDSKNGANDPTAVVGKDGEALSDAEKRVVDELSSIDAKVHEHESAHLAAAGGLAQGGANYTYTEGPDGKLYATAGEVSIDTSSTGDAQKDVAKAQQIQAAAMAPADPSPQDYRVAADAAIMQMEAQMKASEELNAELRKTEGVKLYQENMDFFERERSAPRSFQAVA